MRKKIQNKNSFKQYSSKLSFPMNSKYKDPCTF